MFSRNGGGLKVVAIHAGRSWWYKSKRHRYWHFASRAVAASAFSDSVRRAKKETPLLSTQKMQAMQNLLVERRLLKGRYADGVYGPRTRAAILKFERQRNLAPLGLPTDRIFRELQRK